MFGMSNRIILFLTLMMIFLGIFFFIGNIKGYQDSTLGLISICIDCIAIGCIIFIIYSFFLMFYAVIKTRKVKLFLYFFFYLLTGAISAVFLMSSASIQFLQFPV